MSKAGAKPAAQPTAADALPSSVKSTFSDIFKLVDDKLYKRAVKAADIVLKKVPTHGPTISMKGLALYNMGKKEEAFALAKEGLKHDLKSYVCWHVFGTLHRAELNYTESLKAYRNAVRFAPDNMSAMRDLAHVQIALRDYRGHHETRRQLLTVNSKLGMSWVGFAVAHHLAGNDDMCLAVLEQYTSNLDASRAPTYDVSELRLFQARVLERSGQHLRALELLLNPTIAGQILDQLAYQERLATLLLHLGRRAEAAGFFAGLLHINSEHHGYHRGLQAAVLGDLSSHASASSPTPASALTVAGLLSLSGTALPSNSPAVQAVLTESQVDALAHLYLRLALRYPRSRAARRIALDLLSHGHAAFAPLLSAYMRAGLRRGLPSLFTDLKSLYRAPEDRGLPWSGRQARRRAAAAAASGADEAALLAAAEAAGVGAGGVVPTPKAAVAGRLLVAYSDAITASRPLPVEDVAGGDAAVEALLARMRAAAAANPVLGSFADAAASASAAGGAGGAAASSSSSEEGLARALQQELTPAALRTLFNAPGDGEVESPSIAPWLHLFRARHADEGGASAPALATIDAGIAHTPTIQDLYVARARLLKHGGALWAAADTMNRSRELDLADRYLNVKTVQYLLRAGRVDAAHRTLALFTRTSTKESSGDPLGDVPVLEVLWYQAEVAAAYERVGNYGLALKHYAKVDSIFKAFVEDQHDFHQYCLRKGPLRAYVDCLAMTDMLKGHSHFLRATAGAVRCYLALAEEAGSGAGARTGSRRWDAPAVAEAQEALEAAAAAGGASAGSAAAPAEARAAAHVARTLALARGQVENARAAAASIKAVADAKAKAAGGGAAAAKGKDGKGGKKEDDDDDDDDKPAAGGAGAGSGSGAAAGGKKSGEEDEDHLGDGLAATADPLEAAHAAVGVLLSNLPQEVPASASVARALTDASTGRMATPGVLVAAQPASDSGRAFRGWNAPPTFVAEAHALAARVALARGKLLPALASVLSSQRAAAQAPIAAWARAATGAGAADVPLHHLHPASLGASLRVYKAVELSLAGGEASPLARAADSLRATLARPDQLCGAASADALAAQLAPKLGAIAELRAAIADAAPAAVAAASAATLRFSPDAAARPVTAAAAAAAASLAAAGAGAGAVSVPSLVAPVVAAMATVAQVRGLEREDALAGRIVGMHDVLGVAIIGEKPDAKDKKDKEKEKEKEKEGAAAAAAAAGSAAAPGGGPAGSA